MPSQPVPSLGVKNSRDIPNPAPQISVIDRWPTRLSETGCAEGRNVAASGCRDWRPSTTHYGSIFTPNSAPLEPEAAQSYSFRERGIPPRQSSSLQSAIFMGD
jgi:hypothetical protein